MKYFIDFSCKIYFSKNLFSLVAYFTTIFLTKLYKMLKFNNFET